MRRQFRPLAALAAAALLTLIAAGALVPVATAQQQPAPIEIQVLLGDISVRPSVSSVPAGVPVRFVARNGGTMSHQLALTAPNARSAVLAPGESHTFELVFGAPASIFLFCPIGDVPLLPGVSHRQKGMEAAFTVTAPPAGVTIQATPAIAPAPQIAALTAPGANDDRVGLPENYRERLGTFYVFDRSDNRQVRHVFGNQAALAAREGQPFPYGSILVMETWRTVLGPNNQPALDANGRFIKEEVAGIFVMRKERGFGAKYGPDRTGEWEYVAFRPDGTGFATAPDRSQACAQCHLAAANAHMDWVVRANIFFANPRAALPSLLRLPATGHGALTGQDDYDGHGEIGGVTSLPASVPMSVFPLVLAAAVPLLVGAASVTRQLRRRTP